MKKLGILLCIVMILIPFNAIAADRCRIDVIAFTLPSSTSWIQAALDDDVFGMETLLEGLHPSGTLENDVNPRLLCQAVDLNKGTLLPVAGIEANLNQRVQFEMSADIQYLEKDSSGHLIPRDIPKEDGAGLWLDMTVGDLNEFCVMDYSMLVRVISDREEISGVSLNVGQPVFSEITAEDSISTHANSWMLVDAVTVSNDYGKSDVLCIVTKVSSISE